MTQTAQLLATVTPQQLRAWAVYGVAWFPEPGNDTTETIFIGVSPVSAVMLLTEARNNSAVAPLFEKPGAIRVFLLGVYLTETEARMTQGVHVTAQKPYGNIHGKQQEPATGKRGRVQCVDTGETYDSAAAAARAHGVQPSQMSEHLNGNAGRNTCAGRRFIRL